MKRKHPPALSRALSLDWEDIRCFIALAHHGTLNAASREINIAPDQVERRIANLEGALGQALFARVATKFELTAHGAAALADAAQMEMGACSLVQKSPGVP